MCPFCQRTYQRDAALREHVRFCQEREGGGRLVCPLCGYVAPYRAQMDRHVAMHSLAQSKVRGCSRSRQSDTEGSGPIRFTAGGWGLHTVL